MSYTLAPRQTRLMKVHLLLTTTSPVLLKDHPWQTTLNCLHLYSSPSHIKRMLPARMQGKAAALYRWWNRCKNIRFNYLSLGGLTGLLGSASHFDISNINLSSDSDVFCPCRQTRKLERTLQEETGPIQGDVQWLEL